MTTLTEVIKASFPAGMNYSSFRAMQVGEFFRDPQKRLYLKVKLSGSLGATGALHCDGEDAGLVMVSPAEEWSVIAA